MSSVVHDNNVDIVVAELCSTHRSSQKLSTKCPYTVVDTISDEGYDITMEVLESTHNSLMRSSSGQRDTSGLVTIENGALLAHDKD